MLAAGRLWNFAPQQCNLLSNTVRRLPKPVPSQTAPLSVPRSQLLPVRETLADSAREKEKRKCKVMKLKAPYPSPHPWEPFQTPLRQARKFTSLLLPAPTAPANRHHTLSTFSSFVEEAR